MRGRPRQRRVCVGLVETTTRTNTSGCFCNQSVARRPDSNPSQSLRAAAKRDSEKKKKRSDIRIHIFEFPAYITYSCVGKKIVWGNTSEGGVTFWMDEIILPWIFTHHNCHSATFRWLKKIRHFFFNFCASTFFLFRRVVLGLTRPNVGGVSSGWWRNKRNSFGRRKWKKRFLAMFRSR